MRIDTRGDAAGRLRRSHADIVAENDTSEAHVLAQDLAYPARRITSGFRRNRRVRDVRKHHRFRTGGDTGHERNQILGLQRGQRTRIGGGVEVGVFQHRSMARKMLECRRHPCAVHAAYIGAGECSDHLGRIRKCAVANRSIAAPKIHYRRETQVQSTGANLARHQPCMFLGQRQRCGWIARIQRAEFLQRRQRGVPIAETLHTTALLVHAQ